ncbi:MAG: hypothetical protein ABJ387_03605 [Balneola sp.]
MSKEVKIYYKCTDVNSATYKKATQFFKEEDETRSNAIGLIDEFGISGSSIKMNGRGVLCFDCPSDLKLPKGLRISRSGNFKGYTVPDLKTKEGKVFAERMKEFKRRGSEDLTALIFGDAPFVLGFNNTMITGVGFSLLKNMKTIIISTTANYIDEIKKCTKGAVPEELIEITVSEVIILKGKNEEMELEAKS